MKNHLQKLQETFQWLKENGLADTNADLYLSAAFGSKPKRLDDLRRFHPEKITFYGGLRYQDILLQFNKLRGKTRYDAILQVTDAESEDFFLEESKKLPSLSVPLWMVHLGGLPPTYDDEILKLIAETGGGMCERLPDVLYRLRKGQFLKADGYAWLIDGPFLDYVDSEPSEKGFAPLAARVLLLALRQQSGLSEWERFERMHALTQQFKFASPYSAMLAPRQDAQQ